MDIFQTNFNYEQQLYQNLNSANKWAFEFEYLFLWLESSSCLCAKNKYSSDYLKTILKEKGEPLPPIDYFKNSNKNWWGPLENISLEKKINSKLTSSEFAIKNDLAHRETSLVSSLEFIEKKVLSSSYDRWLIKSPYSFSGKDFFNFSKESFSFKETKNHLNRMLLESSLILEPFLQRIQDFGITVFLNDPGSNFILTENIIDEKYQYKGSLYSPERDISRIVDLEIIEKISSHYKKLGAKDQIQIDFFTYLENSERKFYYLSEVNYRKTMGFITWKLQKILSPQNLAFFFITNKPQNFSIKKGERLIQLSPSNRYFQTYFFSSDRLERIKECSHHFFLTSKDEMSEYKL